LLTIDIHSFNKKIFIKSNMQDLDIDEKERESVRRRISVRNQMKKATGRRAKNPCSERSKDKCLKECVWADHTIWWGGTCKDNDLFSEYVSVICDEDFLDKVTFKREVRNIAKHLGYTVHDFDQTAWKNVTKRQLCRRVSSDTEKIKNFLQKTDEPWKDLGISKKTYIDIFNYAALQYAEGKSFYGIFDSVSKYIDNQKIKKVVAGVALVLIIVLAVVSMAPTEAKSVGTESEIQMYKTQRGINITTMETKPIISSVSQGSKRYLEPSVTQNSILDLIGHYDPIIARDVETTRFSTVTNVDDLEKNMMDLEEVLMAQYCDIGTTIEKQYIESVIDAVRNSPKNPESYRELKDWGMLPGQQIYYGGAFGVEKLIHHGIYLGDGVVLEVGQGPQKCKKVSRNVLSFKDQMTGLSTLTNFARRARKQGSSIYILSTPEDADPETIIRRMERAQHVMGCTDYNILWTNCQHIANYISFGVRESSQADAVIKGTRWIIVGTAALGALIVGWMTKKRQLENKVPLQA
jgi:hypothetical protein